MNVPWRSIRTDPGKFSKLLGLHSFEEAVDRPEALADGWLGNAEGSGCGYLTSIAKDSVDSLALFGCQCDPECRKRGSHLTVQIPLTSFRNFGCCGVEELLRIVFIPRQLRR